MRRNFRLDVNSRTVLSQIRIRLSLTTESAPTSPALVDVPPPDPRDQRRRTHVLKTRRASRGHRRGEPAATLATLRPVQAIRGPVPPARRTARGRPVPGVPQPLRARRDCPRARRARHVEGCPAGHATDGGSALRRRRDADRGARVAERRRFSGRTRRERGTRLLLQSLSPVGARGSGRLALHRVRVGRTRVRCSRSSRDAFGARYARRARYGSAGGESPTRADEKKKPLRERETAELRVARRRDPPRAPPRRSMSGDRFRSDALAAFDDVRRALRDAGVSRTKTRCRRAEQSSESKKTRETPVVSRQVTGSSIAR